MSRHHERQGDFADFASQKHLRKIHAISGFLPKLKAMIPWESFRCELEKIRVKQNESGLGTPAFDVVLMFKILVLQSLYNLSDDQAELQIRDRLSFKDFLDLAMSDRVPDAKTIWLFRENLAKLGLERTLFERFHEQIAKAGVQMKSGLIVDGSFVEVPKQRNTKDENAQIKAGEVPESITSKPNKARQKDTDSRWGKKGKASFFVYKNHVLADAKTKLITEILPARKCNPRHDVCRLRRNAKPRKIRHFIHFGETDESPDMLKLYCRHNIM